ncbi:hypothetical protein IMZ48_46320 [Candidatus Bathyarchaeota archaeon]|nr:hypothetical protein [Candidatus Bathyarchaeota archaeon]
MDSDLKGLDDLFRKGRKIGMEFIYKEVTHDTTTAKGRKKKSATDVRSSREPLKLVCRGKYCKQEPHCLSDERGNYHKLQLQLRHLEAILDRTKRNMHEGEKEEEADTNIEILSIVSAANLKGGGYLERMMFLLGS